MVEPMLISLDAMGGDLGPQEVISGAALALERYPGVRFAIFGDEELVRPLVLNQPQLAKVSDLHHAEVVVRMEDKPSQVMRSSSRRSSMWKAIESIKTNGASAAISTGNTGALMSMSVLCLRTIPNISRPALATIWPSLNKGPAIVLDVGANVSADEHRLVDFAVMGAAMASSVLKHECPTVALLNIGTEKEKGTEEVKRADARLSESQLPFRYIGFIEGDDISEGMAHVIVTNGFTGNVVLKAAEGAVDHTLQYLRTALRKNWFSRLGSWLAKEALTGLRSGVKLASNGGVMLGLNGIVVKSHGKADAASVASAIALACDMAGDNFLLNTIEKFNSCVNLQLTENKTNNK